MRFSRIKDNFIAMFPQLGRIALSTLRDDELYQAERDLMGAELNAEHWIAQRDMLRNRTLRLKAQQQPGAGKKDTTQPATPGMFAVSRG